MKPVIEAKHLGKSYDISHQSENRPGYGTLKDDFENFVKHPLGGGKTKDNHETFWALNDVSFSVGKGEIFGIVGQNGSGKSTLLKILSRIVVPTRGEVHLRGRVASLLEVGTGFHPELTGRENIFLNGSMLGMSIQETKKKFDEIVEFSEVEKFLDTPVKYYSSGMYVRLAFSVAAHLEPEILILDEVLSVGDAAFQKKSLQKILSTMEDGRTVLFVSHSMGSVQEICKRGLLLKNGEIDFIGDVDGLTARYMGNVNDIVATYGTLGWKWKNDQQKFSDIFKPQEMFVTDASGSEVVKPVTNDKPHFLNIIAEVTESNPNMTMGYSISDENSKMMYFTYQTDSDKKHPSIIPSGKIHMKALIPAHFLNAGIYKIALVGGVHNERWIFEPGGASPTIKYSISGGLSDSHFWQNPREGFMAPVIPWEIQKHA